MGTGAAGGFGGPAAAYIGRASLHTRVRALAEEAKVAAQQKPTERALGSEEDKALQSRLRTTGKDNAPLETGGGEPTAGDGCGVEWCGSVSPLRKQETEQNAGSIPFEVRAELESRKAANTVLIAAAVEPDDGTAAPPYCYDLRDMTADEVEAATLSLTIDLQGAVGRPAGSEEGDERGYAAVVTWGPGAAALAPSLMIR